MAIANNTPRISNLVAGQLPEFVRADHATFVAFLEAYYEWLEQSNATLSEGGVIERAKNLMSYRDIDKTMEQFKELLYKEFLSLIPKNVSASKELILKNVKDFYRAKGTEKSYRFLLRILTGEEISSFYYPKQDILRASDGKWYIQKTIRIGATNVNGTPDSSVPALNLWVNEKIYGNTSGATAIIDQAQQFYENGSLVNELTLSSISGTFSSSETIFANYGQSLANTLYANVFSGAISSLTVYEAGAGYVVGQLPPVEAQPGDIGSGGVVQISAVSEGNIQTVSVLTGGAGFRASRDYMLFSGGGASVQANAVVQLVDESGTTHPNSYNIVSDVILYEANTPIGNAVYTNLFSSNANTKLINALHQFVYANTGPILSILVNSGGSGYTSAPGLDVVANTRILSLGILGKLQIFNGGAGYAANDRITFLNVPGGHGFGALANVVTVNGTGAITSVAFIPSPGYLPGGSGYSNEFLPTLNIATVGGSGANIRAITTLGDGESLAVETGTIGAILAMAVVNPGGSYSLPPYINLQSFGSGTANVVAEVVQGLFEYPGRYLNDDGQLSSYNFLQDRDYYQNYSYVLRLRKTLDVYKQTVLDILHPAGMILFGEFLYEQILDTSQLTPVSSSYRVEDTVNANAIYFAADSVLRKNIATDGLGGIRSNNSNTGAFSVWLNPASLPTDGNSAYIFYLGRGTNNNSYVRLTNTKSQMPNSATGISIEIKFGAATGNANVLYLKSDANSHPIRTNTWIHLLSAWNSRNLTQSYIFIDNTDSTIRVSNSAAIGTWNIANAVFGAHDDLTSSYIGSMAELVISNAAINLANVAERVLFANNSLPRTNVANVLIAAGKGAPIVYFKNASPNFNVNYGVGGTFSNVINTLVDAAITPTSELL